VSLAPVEPGARPARGARTAAPALLALATKRPDLVEVSTAQRVLGYIEVVDHVFVVLVGPRYDIALEFEQTLDFDHALHALQEGSRDDHR
jgi:hypothetical protein